MLCKVKILKVIYGYRNTEIKIAIIFVCFRAES